MYFVFADLIWLRYSAWKNVILKYSCFNQRTQTIARRIYQRKLKWSYESLVNFFFKNFVNRGIILEIAIFQNDFEEPFNFKSKKKNEFWVFLSFELQFCVKYIEKN